MIKSLVGNRRLQRMVLGSLRRWMPLSRWGNNILVASHSEVTEVLRRSKDFSVLPIYEEKMRRTSGDFYLGMDNSPQYARERQLTDCALRAMSMDRYRQLAREFSKRAVEQAAARGVMDVVQELSWLVPVQLCEEFFGVSGPDRRSLRRWMRYIFQHLFLNLGDDPVVAARAEKLSIDLRHFLAALVTERKAEPAQQLAARTDFVSQLVQLQKQSSEWISDDVLVRNIGGVVLGSVDTLSRAVINVLEELFARPQQLKLAHGAACRGDTERVAQFAFEALRFNPHNPLIVRRPLQDTQLQGQRGPSFHVPKGSRVFALTYAAMFDPAKYPEPEKFVPDRSEYSHLQFGDGLHRCFGERLVLMAVPEILMSLLCREDLKRAAGTAGVLIWDGPFPDHFRVTFKPSNTSSASC